MRAFAQSIVETVRHPLLILDTGLRIWEANPAFYRTFGGCAAEVKGRTLSELADGQWDIPGLRAIFDRLAQEPVEGVEVEHSFPGLERKVLLFNAHHVFQDDGTRMILLAIEDITERVLAREELVRLNQGLEDRIQERTAQLETTNRELEAFCYSVSHDLRAPLRALDGFSDELLRRYADRLDEKGQHYLRRLRQGTQRMGHLIDDMLKLSRLSRGDLTLERVDLTALAGAIGAELRSREQGRNVNLVIGPGLSAVGDRSLLRAALENLLGNAWKFTSQHPSAAIEVGRAESRGGPAFFVKDDGAGFDMAHASKLFGAFQRLHLEREFPGNGIGLATVQRIIHRLGGQIWAEGAPERGATFYFTLPLKETP